MELRPDIATAAAGLTSGFDVDREIRQLSLHLREEETVQRLTSGVFDQGVGLMAVTDHRVLLLRVGRGGQVSEGLALNRLSSVGWAARAARGTIRLTDKKTTIELKQVPLTEGARIVALIESTSPAARSRRRRRVAFGGSGQDPTPEQPPEVRAPVTEAAKPRNRYAVTVTLLTESPNLVGSRPAPEPKPLPGPVPARTPTPAPSRVEAPSPRPAAVGRPAPPTTPPARPPAGRPQAKRRDPRVWLGVGAMVGLVGLASLGVGVHLSSPEPETVSAAAPSPAPAASPSAGVVVTVAKVFDVNSIEVAGPVSGPVELLGISPPLSARNQCGSAEAEAKAFAIGALIGNAVTLTIDPSLPPTGPAGPWFASLRLPSGTDYAVLAAGVGMAAHSDLGRPVALAAETRAAQGQAEKARLGLWGPPCNGRFAPTGNGPVSAPQTTG